MSMPENQIYNYQLGKIIVFEGINKAGKSYMISLLEEQIEVHEGLEVSKINIKDLYKESDAALVEKVLKRTNAGYTYDEVSRILDLHEELLERALELIDEGVDYVFVDRFVLSAYVYNIVCNALLTDGEKEDLTRRYEALAKRYQDYQARVILLRPRDPNVSKNELDVYTQMVQSGTIPGYDSNLVCVARSGDVSSVIKFMTGY